MDLSTVKGHVPFYTELKIKELELESLRTGFSEEIRTRDRLIRELQSEISRLESSVFDEHMNVSKAERSFEDKLKLKQEGYGRLLAEYNLAALERKESESKLVEGMSEIMASVDREAKIQLEVSRQALEKKESEKEELRVANERIGLALDLHEHEVLNHFLQAKESSETRVDSLRGEVEAVKLEVERMKKAIHVIADRNISLEDHLGSKSEEGKKIMAEMNGMREKYEDTIAKMHIEFTYKAEDLTRRNQVLSEQAVQLRRELEVASVELQAAKSRISELTDRSDGLVENLQDRVRELVSELDNSRTACREVEFELHDAKREFSMVLKKQQEGYLKLVEENGELLEKLKRLEDRNREAKETHETQLEAVRQELHDERNHEKLISKELNARIYELDHQLIQFRTALSEKDLEIISLSNGINSMKESSKLEVKELKSSFLSQVQDLTIRAEIAERERDSAFQKIAEVEVMRSELAIVVSKLQSQLRSICREKEELSQQLEIEKIHGVSLQKSLHESQKVVETLYGEVKESKREMAELGSQVESGRVKLEAAHDRIRAITAKADVERERSKLAHEMDVQDLNRLHEKQMMELRESQARESGKWKNEISSLKTLLEQESMELSVLKESHSAVSKELKEALIREESNYNEKLHLENSLEFHRNQLAFISHELNQEA